MHIWYVLFVKKNVYIFLSFNIISLFSMLKSVMIIILDNIFKNIIVFVNSFDWIKIK